MTSTTHRTPALFALAAAGVLWGSTVPLSKLGLEWLDASWLAFVRFALAAPLLALIARRHLRGAWSPGVVLSGALGYGAVMLLQNVGLERTSVTHAALIVGATPVLVAIIAAAAGRGVGGAVTWGGSLIALLGVALVAGSGGSGSTPAGDLLVLLSVSGSAAFIVVQPRLLRGRDAGAVTALQRGGGALLALPVALLFGDPPGAPSGGGVVVAVLALASAGTLASYWLFAWAQARVPAELASAFVNLEPLVGALAGVIAFHEAFGTTQVLGGFAILAAIALSAAEPAQRERRPRRSLRHVFAD